jgi:2-polyprenyl-3-methyl-5-hydroxy-6-metoxy-1,4-benzoquinol methylase
MSKSTTERDMKDYTAQYYALPFEPFQAKYRRALVLREVARKNPKRLLEIGCGVTPLFTDLGEDIEVTVIEPTDEFSVNARKLADTHGRVNIVQSFVEDYTCPQADFDMIVLSCLLHEVSDPARLLASVRRLCNPDTLLHVNVPNAGSLHRLLAVSMGLIADTGVQSEAQRTMQQRAMIYDMDSLQVELNNGGFTVTEHGSIFIKPFTHGQMQRLIDDGFMTPDMLDGFDKLANVLPELGSEIWVNARRDK